MKIVHVIGALVAGGAEKFVGSLAIEIALKGIDVEVWVLSARTDPAGEKLYEMLRASDVTVRHGPLKRVTARTVYWFGRQLWKCRPNVLHLHTPNTELTYGLARLFAPSCRYLFRTIHNTNPERRLLYRWPYLFNRVHASIACGNAAAEAHKAHISGGMTVIENGVKFTWDSKTSERTLAAKARLGLSRDKVQFLSIGRMNADRPEHLEKGFDLLLEAWRTSFLPASGAVLNICGDGNQVAKLKQMAASSSGVAFHGIVDNVHEWLMACDVFVMPSRREGLPIAGIEAAGTGIRCVFSDIAPLKELNVPCAILASANDSASLCRALEQAFSEALELAVIPSDAIRERYGIERAATEYIKCYTDAIDAAYEFRTSRQ